MLKNSDGKNDDSDGGSVVGILHIMLIVIVYLSMICSSFMKLWK